MKSYRVMICVQVQADSESDAKTKAIDALDPSIGDETDDSDWSVVDVQEINPSG